MKHDNILSFLLGLALGIIFVGIVALAYIDINASTVDYTVEGRTVEVFPEPVTVVEISIEPRFVRDLAEGDPEPPVVAQTILRILPSTKSLSKAAGRIIGPSGNEETWYDLNMSRVIQSMRNRGYSEDEYPYWVREDGCKMLGDYIMVAADLTDYSKGDIVMTSLGSGIVCDTGTDLKGVFDLATNWNPEFDWGGW